MTDEEQTIQDQQREQQDAERLGRLPPRLRKLMNREQRAKILRWYMSTAEGKECLRRKRNNTAEGMFAGYITKSLVDARMNKLVVKRYGSYVREKWSSDGKRPPQPASNFLFHKRFSRCEALIIRLPLPPMDKVKSLIFDQQELDQIFAAGLPTIVTAVGSRELHFHEEAKLRKIKFEDAWIISTEENYEYMQSAIAEFKELNTTEVWFRRAKDGKPQFIFCPGVDSAQLPLLPLPLSTPGQPQAVLELGRLESMPALLPEMFREEHKDDFHKWLLETNKFHIEDEDPGNLELRPLLLRLRTNGFHICHLTIPLVIRLYAEYVHCRWSMPHKQPPSPQSVYLFERGVQCEKFWIWLPQDLMRQASFLILNKTEHNQLARSYIVPVVVSVKIDGLCVCGKPGVLTNVETGCRISFSHQLDEGIFRVLREAAHLEVWFLRTQDQPDFIIKTRERELMRSN